MEVNEMNYPTLILWPEFLNVFHNLSFKTMNFRSVTVTLINKT